MDEPAPEPQKTSHMAIKSRAANNCPVMCADCDVAPLDVLMRLRGCGGKRRSVRFKYPNGATNNAWDDLLCMAGLWYRC